MEWKRFLIHNLQNTERGNYQVFNPAYQEEILSWLKREDIDKSQKDTLIEALMNFQDECGGFFRYQAYFIAAKYINTFKNSSFAEEIVNQLLYWSFDFFRAGENIVNSKLEKEARQSLKDTDLNRVISSFEKLIQSTNEQDILLDISKQLIEIDINNQIATSTLVNILCTTEDNNSIFKILDFLVEKKIKSENFTDVLVKLVDRIKSGDSIEFEAWVSNTFYFLKKIAIGNQKGVEALVKLIGRLPIPYQGEDEYLCEEVIKTLEVIGKNSNLTINTLTNFLQKNRLDSLNYWAARALCYIDSGNLLAVNTCIQLLENPKDIYVTYDVAIFLLKQEANELIDVEAVTTLAINVLIDYIKEGGWINRTDIFTLEEVTRNNKTVLQSLFKLLEVTQNIWIRIAIANSLLRIDLRNQQALTVIYQALNSIDNQMLYVVAKDLLDIIPDDRVAIDVLCKLLVTSKDQYSRLEIAKRLLKLEPSNQTAIDTLCELVYMPRLHNCISKQDLALPALEKIDSTNQLVIKAIEDFCKETKDQDALIYFIKYLRELDSNSDMAQKRLDHIIAALVNSIKSYDHNDDCALFNVAIYWRGIMESTLLPEIVIALKPFLRNRTSARVDNYTIAYGIIWDCAKKIGYQDFYKAWHAKC